MPHAALWVVQRRTLLSDRRILCGFNAARGFVGGAADRPRRHRHRASAFQCRTRLCGWCSLKFKFILIVPIIVSMPHAALWVVQHTLGYGEGHLCMVSMPHAALWVVQPCLGYAYAMNSVGFNAARGFVGGAAYPRCSPQDLNWMFQCRTRLCGWCSFGWCLIRPFPWKFQCRTRLCGWCSPRLSQSRNDHVCFNAARGFVGGAAGQRHQYGRSSNCFNAARGFVGGAASSLSALVPLRGKRPFGKSPEI